jgi:lipopolysaccharide transport system permease protein
VDVNEQSVPVLRIEPRGLGLGPALRELWHYRGLFWFLVWRDIRVRYAQSVLGVGWAVLQPVLMTGVVTILFGHFARMPSDNAPYWAFSLVALVPWTFLSTGVTSASNSLVMYPNLITKVYFPRLIIPFAPVLAALVDFASGFLLIIVALALAGSPPRLSALAFLPLLLVLMVMVAVGVGCWLAAANIKYRDVKYTVPFLVQVWMFASPVVYPASVVPEAYRALYGLNPMAGIIEGFRLTLLDTGAVSWSLVTASVGAAFALFVTGVLYFQHVENTFADVI